MKTQRSRNSFDELKRYSGVYQQMGRMFTDSDWNELTDMAKHRLAEALTDVIGSGTPRDRGIVKVEGSSGIDVYSLQWGHAYVDGIMAELRPDPTAALIDPAKEAFEYEHQADFPSPPPTVGACTLYLDVWERTVLSLEDDDLRDPGLRGADTCTRTQTMAQVKWCPTALNPELPSDNPAIGSAELTLELTEGSSDPDPCDPCAKEVVLQDKMGNYLFRVEVHSVSYDASGNPSALVLKWSHENGSEQVAINDEPEGFASDNWAYEFYSGESEAFASEKHLGRHLATGFTPTVGELQKGYDSVPAGFSLVRRWDGYCELTKSGLTWEWAGGSDLGVDLSTTSDTTDHGHIAEGSTVTIKLDVITLEIALADNQLLAGDFWVKEVRSAVNKLGDQLLIAETPQGIEHHYLTLGDMAANGEFTPLSTDHCKRFNFPPLTDIRAGDVCYDVPGCGDTAGEQATVRRLLEEQLGSDFPDPGATQVSTILDALLCSHSAATLPLQKDAQLCPTLQDDSIQSVQDALNALCVLKSSGCSSITVFPEPNWHLAIANLPAGQDANICFRPGEYPLEDTLLIADKGHLKVSGAGAGTRIVCSSREAALHFSKCASVSVSGISVEAGAVGKGAGSHDYIYGALTATGCNRVTIDQVNLKCAAGTYLGATCLTVSNARERSGSVAVNGCELSVGHKQTGMLLLNMQRSVVQNNRLNVRVKPKSITLERQVLQPKFAAKARKLLLNNAVIRSFEDSDTDGLKSVDMREQNSRQMYIKSPVSGNDWSNLISRQAGVVKVNSNQHLLSIAKNAARRVLVDKNFRADFRPFAAWFEKLRSQNPACAHSGIVCAGQVASDIQIIGNSVRGAQEGIHVGVSDHSLSNSQNFTAGRVLVSANNISLIIPPVMEGRRGGVFVGNCNNLTIQDNQILIQRFPLSRRLYLEGVRVYGRLGPMMMIRQNYMTSCTVGVRVKPVDMGKESGQWLVADNMMPKAELAVDAPDQVRRSHNMV